MSVQKWLLHDPGGVIADYHFEINPFPSGSSDLLPNFVKNIIYSVQVAPNQMPLIFEGRNTQLQTSTSGTFVTQDQYLSLVQWFNLTRPFQLTDDIGNQFIIYPLQFQPSRKRSRNFPWRADYTFNWIVLSAIYS